ncbi:MAG TPA: DUF4272 domain-containing protein [Cyclobacteriaceae bacterium]|nr:DUF4272 domain-containing protein [Cyclobacteriaceae bacterium]
METAATEFLNEKKKRLEKRLATFGITDRRITHLPYLEHHPESFQSPHDAGCRMFILYAVATVSYFPDERYAFINLLKDNNMWDLTTSEEQDFLLDKNDADEKTNDMAWKFDAARTLAWCLNLFDDVHPIDRIATQDEDSEFMEFIMNTRDNIPAFLRELYFRPLEEIHEEYLLNELAMEHCRDNALNSRADNTNIKWPICSERHNVLTWLTTLSS